MSKKYNVKIKSIQFLTHDVLQFVTDKPEHYNFSPGQACEISISKTGWNNEQRPFTFTSLPENDYLEFIIKTYPLHNSVTNELLQQKIDDELILSKAFGKIRYNGEGVFIAGGAGVTPFISILRFLKSKNELFENKLIFANKTKDDIIIENEFKTILGKNFINILSADKNNRYAHGRITEKFLKYYINSSTKNIYLCGPLLMMDEIKKQLTNLGIQKKIITTENI
ncbi:MAG: hypothetical protein WAR79_00055 [Melioribacteraceae bacterium]